MKTQLFFHRTLVTLWAVFSFGALALSILLMLNNQVLYAIAALVTCMMFGGPWFEKDYDLNELWTPAEFSPPENPLNPKTWKKIKIDYSRKN